MAVVGDEIAMKDQGPTGPAAFLVKDSGKKSIHLKFATVTGLPHSPSKEGFVDISVAKATKHDGPIRATLHHTFASCTGKPVQAKNLKPGHCIYTTSGANTIKSATAVPARKGDETYTVEVERGFGLIAVGGVLSHAKSELMRHDDEAKATMHAAISKRTKTTASQRLASFHEPVLPAASKRALDAKGHIFSTN